MKDILSGNAAMESDAAGDSQGGGLLLQGVSLIAGTDNVQRPGPVHKARQRFQNGICVFSDDQFADIKKAADAAVKAPREFLGGRGVRYAGIADKRHFCQLQPFLHRPGKGLGAAPDPVDSPDAGLQHLRIHPGIMNAVKYQCIGRREIGLQFRQKLRGRAGPVPQYHVGDKANFLQVICDTARAAADRARRSKPPGNPLEKRLAKYGNSIDLVSLFAND